MFLAAESRLQPPEPSFYVEEVMYQEGQILPLLQVLSGSNLDFEGRPLPWLDSKLKHLPVLVLEARQK